MARRLFTRNQLNSLAQRLLEQQPNEIVRYRLLRDIIRLPAGSAELGAARRQMLTHPWVKELADEQLPDGSWGRFHSMDSSLKARFPTSETAIRRGLALGLDKDTPILKSATEYMLKILKKEATWTDRREKSEGWDIAVEAITASTLAEVDPTHPAIVPVWEYWVEICSRCFPNGVYSPEAEWKAHREARKVGIKYLPSRYVVTLLGARSAALPACLDRQLVTWLWEKPDGIGYLGADMRHPEIFHIFYWLESLEILSRFQSWQEAAIEGVEWLWRQRNNNGLWDFGGKISKSFYFPLSNNWRKEGSRPVDQTTRILALLSKI
jgi:hypothetical protein